MRIWNLNYVLIKLKTFLSKPLFFSACTFKVAATCASPKLSQSCSFKFYFNGLLAILMPFSDTLKIKYTFPQSNILSLIILLLLKYFKKLYFFKLYLFPFRNTPGAGGWSRLRDRTLAVPKARAKINYFS